MFWPPQLNRANLLRFLSGYHVTSWSAGSTGFTPSTPTTGDVVLAGTLIAANGGTGVTGFGAISDHTSSPAALTAAQSFQTFTNLGAAGSVTFTLPTPVAGLEYTFIVAAAQTVTLDVGGSVVIAIGEVAGTAGGGASCNSPYSSVTLKAVSTTLWVATSSIGSWTPS